ncbi:uncharacterized protein L199_003815 [Kwoniella botswanensis]|uniref:uncharacterized protein n=1 Tax=Kwoniella botswanensis TaxID=1268659 RepID=UPI00315CD223
MVSILSFFQTKKKGKRARSRSPSPTQQQRPSSAPRPTQQPTPSGTSNTSRPTRFLSLRHKSGSSSSTKPYDLTGRRGGTNELTRKRSKGKSLESSKPDLTSAFIPKLDLGFDIPRTEDAIQKDSLDIHGVGEKMVLRQQEKEVISKLQLSVEEVKLAWEVIGKALRESDLNQHGLVLPLRPNTDPTTQLYLLAIYCLVIRPDLLSNFPTIAAQFAQPTSNPSRIWRERLTSILKDGETSSDLSEVLKYTLRRLQPTPPEPLVDTGLYTAFVKAERSSSYPLDAFETLLSPRLKTGVANYLNEIFEVWSAVITHAEQNAMTPGRLAHLLGWWTWGCSTGKFKSWEELYKDWKSAGQRMEHLLYVWIRHQSTKTQLPTRLLEVVQDYPFGEASTTADQPPSPPPSSFPRQTLHITLTSSMPVTGLFDTPEDILSSSLSAKLNENATAPLWSALKAVKDLDLSKILSTDSMNFLGQVTEPTDIPSTPYPAQMRSPIQVNVTPSGQPTSNGGTFRGRYHSHSGDLSSPATNVSSSTTSPNLSTLLNVREDDDSPKSVKKQASLGVLPKTGGSAWDDFQKSGFGDSPKTAGKLDLAFSPGSTSKPIVPPASTIQLGANITEGPVAMKRATFSDSKGSKAVYGIANEDVIEIDDTFMAFVEDAQLDRPSTASWPPFSLVRLNPLVQPLHCEKVIEWLLITVVHRSPRIPAPEPIPQSTQELEWNRPTSPSSSKAGTPRGFKGITESFKRSSSFQSGMNLRRSFFGTSGFSLSRHVSDELDNLPESESDNAHQLRAPLSAASLTPTEYTITEMGEMIKIPSPNEKEDEAVVGPPVSGGAGPSLAAEKEIDADVATIKGKPMATGLTTGPSVDTLASQWKYAGEGAEHIVFSHRGTFSEYNGKVLRLRKSQFLGNSPTDPGYRQTLNEWTFNLLPQLVPSELLIQTQEVNLAEGWVKDLFAQADATRPEERKLLGDLKSLVVGEAKGVIMEDTTTNEKKDGIVNLAFEIKPKWGFLPDASTIVPPEAAEVKSKHCRFCMHRHLKGHDSSAECKFCPLDLYSGEEVRMKKAINGLWGIWEQSQGKENNWRVFVNGERISPDKSENVAKYFDGGHSLADYIASSIIPILNSSQVFQTLKTLQSTLDPTDISDLASRFSSAHPDAGLFDPALIPSPTSAELEEFIKLYLSSPEAGKTGDAWTLRQRMIGFALSAIFKDCSVFVKFTLASSSPPLSPSTEKTEEKWSLVEGSGKVKIIDLDLKPIQNLGKWRITDDKIWKYWLDTHPSSTPTTTKPERDTQKSDDAVTEEGGRTLDIAIRHKAISGLTLSGISEVGSTNTSDGAPTRALFIPTPDRKRENNPLPTPALVTAGSSMEDSLDPVDPRSDQNHQSESPVEDRGSSVPQAVDEAIEPRRTKRSMAPSPSPPPSPALDIPEQDEDRSKETPKMLKDDVSPEIPLDNESTAQDHQQERDILMPPTLHDDENVGKPQKTDESSSIIGAGLAGLGTVVGLAAEAVHAIVEEFTEPQPEKGQERELVKDDAQVDDQSKAVTSIEPDGVLASEVRQATNPVEEPASTEQRVDNIDTQSISAVDNEHDGQGTNPFAPNEQLNTDNIISSEPAVVHEMPNEEEAEEYHEHTPQAEADRVNVEPDTPQAELENFYTPAETPLISQPPTFDIPANLPAPVETSDSLELPSLTESSDMINDVAQEVSDQADQVDTASTADTPEVTIIPIEDATPKRDGDEAVSDSFEDQGDSAPVPIKIEDTSTEQNNAVVVPASTEINADTPLQSVDSPEAAAFKTGIPASLISTTKDPAVSRDLSSQDVSAPPQDPPEPPVAAALAEENSSLEVDGHPADQVPHDEAEAEGAPMTQHSSAPPPVTNVEIPANQYEVSSSLGLAPVEPDHPHELLEDEKTENTLGPNDDVQASEPPNEPSAGISAPPHSGLGLAEATSNETAKVSEIPPILGQPINSTTISFSNSELSSDNQPIIFEDPTESQDHLSPLVSDHHQAEEPVYDHHDLSTISEDGESSAPSSTDMSKDASLPTTDDGEQWVEDAQPSQEQEEEETPRAIHEILVEEVNVRRPVDEREGRLEEEEGNYESVSEPVHEIPTNVKPAGASNENGITPSESTSIVKPAGEEVKITESVVNPRSNASDDAGVSHLVEKEYLHGITPQP